MKHKDVICSDTVVLSLKNHILGASQLGLDLDTHNIMTYTARPKKASCFIRCAFMSYIVTHVSVMTHTSHPLSQKCVRRIAVLTACVSEVCVGVRRAGRGQGVNRSSVSVGSTACVEKESASVIRVGPEKTAILVSDGTNFAGIDFKSVIIKSVSVLIIYKLWHIWSHFIFLFVF